MSHLMECVRRLFAAVVLVLGVAATAGLSSRQAEIVLSGRVVDAATGVLVPEAVISLNGGTSETIETPDGRFAAVLRSVSGQVRLSATAFGYLRGFPGQRGPTDSLTGAGTIELTPGQPLEDVVIRLWREASVSGRVVDHDDQPIAGAPMVVMTRVFTGAGLRWREVRAASPRTDDRGQFHIASLMPGDYLVAVQPPVDPRAGADATPPVTYYPGTQVAPEAQVVTLMSGTDARADLVVDFRPTLAQVRGRLAGVHEVDGFFVHLVPESLLGAVSALPTLVVTAGVAPVGGLVARVEPDGAFTFRAVPRGSYRAKVWRLPAGAPQSAMTDDLERSSDPIWTADVPVVVDEAPVALIVPLTTGARVRGRLQFEGAVRPDAGEIAAIPLFVRPADGVAPVPVPAARIEADGSFSSPGLPPGDYVIGFGPLAGRLAGWTATSILAQGREVVAGTMSVGAADVDDVVVRVTDRPTALKGTVRDSRGQLVRDGRVIVFPAMASERDQYHAPPARRRVVQAVTDRTGSFAIPLPPGEYLVASVAGDLPAFWMAPDHLAALTTVATNVRVAEDREVTVSVTLR